MAYRSDEAEAARLVRLHDCGILDTSAEPAFDTIVALASRMLDCPIAMVSLVDAHRLWFKAMVGADMPEMPREATMCDVAIRQDDMLVVEDLRTDSRFVANPLVADADGARFYAGMPLRPGEEGGAGPAIGTLCVVDTRPRSFDAAARASLRDLAALVETLIRARVTARTASALAERSRRDAEVLDRRNRQLRQVERMVGIGSWRYDVAADTVEWSDEVFAIYGMPVGPVPPVEVAMSFYPPDDRERLAAAIARAAEHGAAFDIECDFVTADGRIRRVRSIGEAQLVDGRPTAIIGVFQDVTDAHVREQSLRVTASTDSLTGLANRACFEGRLATEYARARDRHEPLALLLLDLDGFKAVNDGFGHDAGDDVLRAIAAQLRGRAFMHVFAARLGGDEFVILVTRPRDCASLPTLIAGMLRDLRHSFMRGSTRRAVSTTIGAALLEGDVASPADLLRRADLALYEAKRDERGTARVFGSDQRIEVRSPRLVLSPAA